MGWYYYKPYVSVAKRRAQAEREVAKRLKKGEKVSPVVIEGRTIVSTFWGKAWCTNLESYSDFANRLPRGRTYVRNGSVVDLKITEGRIKALVSGSELYTVQIDMTALPKESWRVLKALCVGKIGSLVELLRGKLSKGVMEAVTDRAEGLFPKPKEIKMKCSCPDYAGMCKHIAAVMYGIGNRLDSSPELLFQLRGVDHRELIEEAIPTAPTRANHGAPTIESSELGDIFGIEINDSPAAVQPTSKTATKQAPEAKKVPTATKPAAVQKADATKTAKVKKTAEKKTASVQKVDATKTAKVKKSAEKKTASVQKVDATKTAKVKKKTASVKKAVASTRKEKPKAPVQG